MLVHILLFLSLNKAVTANNHKTLFLPLSLINIPDLLREGQNVYVALYNEEEQAYIYQVSQTNVVEAGDFTMGATTDATITLVSCVPKYVYDHRLLVMAKLIGRQG